MISLIVAKIMFQMNYFFELSNYHRNIKLTIEISPTKFLDTQLVNLNGKIETKVYRKPTKLPVPWSSNIPKRYKRNAISGDCIVQNELQQILKRKLCKLKRNS